MKAHPLKLISLGSLGGLILCQLGLMFWLHTDYRFIISSLLTIPLLIPLKGLWQDKRYTFKWVGFLTLLYFSVGISESFSNPALQFYGLVSIICSCLLFISSIYYSRYLRQQA